MRERGYRVEHSRRGRGRGERPARGAQRRLRHLSVVDVFETLPHEELAKLAELCKPRDEPSWPDAGCAL